ncbi:MAG: lipoate--protein ligase family protein [Leptospiraceae bacterium]|nr:lipoate--protein ligase family protein [Leptospiraceae bacterium]MDW7975931.1 lipoate--protein ligase family protein [Leptospiraceae bacterium]
MIIHIPDLKTRNPIISIALEESLAFYYSKVEDFTALLRFWFNPPSIILGRSCKVLENINSEVLIALHNKQKKFLKDKNICLVRRLSGGGTVYHTYGNLNYTFIIPLKKYPEFFSIPNSYNIILNFLIKALKKQNIEALIQGLSDLVIETKEGYKKFSGNSQFRKYHMLVHHGTLILQKNVIEEVQKILKHPPKEPDYRMKRSHEDFLTTLPKEFDISLFYESLLEQLQDYFQQDQIRFVNYSESKELRKILIDKVKNVYSSSEWIYQGKYTQKEIILDF